MKKTLLRTTVISLLFILCSLSLRSQWVSIPDSNFGTWLNTNGYSACMQGNNGVGWQMDTSCPAVVGETQVICNSRNIKDLSGIQYFDSLIDLVCTVNQLPSLPTLPDRLRLLSCDNNLLTSLPNLPDSLIDLRCSSNDLTSLPVLPSNLSILYCYDNLISSLPSLPNGLLYLDCRYNVINSLPFLPNGLLDLKCGSNSISSLPTLPNSLTALSCGYNQLTSLPTLPKGLIVVHCGYNQLTFLPELPDSLTSLYCNNNPNLNCLPRLEKIVNFYFSNTSVNCLPNYPQSNTTSTPPLSSVPICDIFNTNGCDAFWNVNGKVYFDNNSNCIRDGIDSGQRNIKVNLRIGGNLVQEAFTGGEGFYSFDTDSLVTYSMSLDTANTPFYVSCPSNNLLYDSITAIDSFSYNKNFALECKPGFDLAAWSISGVRFRPANFTNVDIHVGGTSNFYGVNCSGGISGSVEIVITGPATYVAPAAGALTPDNVSGNTLTYNVADFGTVDFNNSFNIMVQTDTTAPLGSQICFTVTVSPITGDDVQSNNIQTHCFTVVGSFDPNDKQVYPAGDIDTAQEWLTYTIRFQNTGTAEAQHIYITDTLDSDLDVSSFQLLAYSHQPMVQLKENAVRFNFPNINLPDSNANEPLSHGYVQYKIKLKDNLPIGTAINNTAFIYFDFNAPVVTNTTTNTIAIISHLTPTLSEGEGEMQIHVAPNSASDYVTISMEGKTTGGTLTITDMMGRAVHSFSFGEGVRQRRTDEVAVAAFSKGVYFVTVTDKDGRSVTKKLIIQK